MPWSEIDGGDWLLPASRNKTKVDLLRPLSAAALATLPEKAGEFVFSNDGVGPLCGFAELKRVVDRATGPMERWTLHDLRRTARSLMSRAGVLSDHAEQCLGHVLGGVRGIYDRHAYHDEKARAYEKLASLVECIVHPVENVVPLVRQEAEANATGRFPASGSRTRLQAVAHGMSRPSTVRRTSEWWEWWEIETEFLVSECGVDPDTARTWMMLRWLCHGDLRPLEAAMVKRQELDQAVLDLLADMISGDTSRFGRPPPYRLKAVPLRRGRPKKRPEYWLRDLVAGRAYEAADGKSDEVFDHIAKAIGRSHRTVRQAVTAFRKAQRAK
jgi:hypothetical protein